MKKEKRIITYYLIAIIPGIHANFGKMVYWTLNIKSSLAFSLLHGFRFIELLPFISHENSSNGFSSRDVKDCFVQKNSRNFSNKGNQKFIRIKVINNFEVLENFHFQTTRGTNKKDLINSNPFSPISFVSYYSLKTYLVEKRREEKKKTIQISLHNWIFLKYNSQFQILNFSFLWRNIFFFHSIEKNFPNFALFVHQAL